MSRPAPAPGEPPSPPQPCTRKRCLKLRPPNLRRTAQKTASSSSANSSDSDARALSPHKAAGKGASYLGKGRNVDEGYYGDSEDVVGDDGAGARARSRVISLSTVMKEIGEFLQEESHKSKIQLEAEIAKKEEQQKLITEQWKLSIEQSELSIEQSDRDLMALRKKILSSLMKKQELTAMEERVKNKLIAMINGSKLL